MLHCWGGREYLEAKSRQRKLESAKRQVASMSWKANELPSIQKRWPDSGAWLYRNKCKIIMNIESTVQALCIMISRFRILADKTRRRN